MIAVESAPVTKLSRYSCRVRYVDHASFGLQAPDGCAGPAIPAHFGTQSGSRLSALPNVTWGRAYVDRLS